MLVLVSGHLFFGCVSSIAIMTFFARRGCNSKTEIIFDVIQTTTGAQCIKSAHTVGAHGAQSHWSYRLHRERGDFRVDPSDESSCEDGGVEIWTREHSSYRADFEPNQLDGDFHRS